jgi:hypothetical protein
MRADGFALDPAVREPLSEWLLEVSALLAVFPLIDQLVAPWSVHSSIVVGSDAVALIFMLVAIDWKRRSH